MEHLTFLLTVPGDLLADLFFPALSFDATEVRADLGVTLGIVFWLVTYLVVRLTWKFAGHLLAGGARNDGAIMHDQVRLIGQRVQPWWHSRTRTWTLPKFWGAVWRAQVAHMALYAVVPLLWEAARLALFVVFLPFVVMGFGGNKGSFSDGSLDHLSRPACWTFVTFCPGPHSRYLHTPVIQASECRSDGTCPPGHALVYDSGGWFWKMVWAALTLTLIASWRNRQRQRNSETPRISGPDANGYSPLDRFK